MPNPSAFGVAELADGRIVRLVEKPAEPRSDLALVGVYMFADRFSKPSRRSSRPRGELEITDAIQWLVDHGRTVHPHLVTGWWKDTGKVEDMLEANRIVLDTIEGDVRDELPSPGSTVVSSSIPAPSGALSGPAPRDHWRGRRLNDGYIGPYTAIGVGGDRERRGLKYSIRLAESSVRGLAGGWSPSCSGERAHCLRMTASCVCLPFPRW